MKSAAGQKMGQPLEEGNFVSNEQRGRAMNGAIRKPSVDGSNHGTKYLVSMPLFWRESSEVIQNLEI